MNENNCQFNFKCSKIISSLRIAFLIFIEIIPNFRMGIQTTIALIREIEIKLAII